MTFSQSCACNFVPLMARLVLGAAFIFAGYNKLFVDTDYDAGQAKNLRDWEIVDAPPNSDNDTEVITPDDDTDDDSAMLRDESNWTLKQASFVRYIQDQEPPLPGGAGEALDDLQDDAEEAGESIEEARERIREALREQQERGRDEVQEERERLQNDAEETADDIVDEVQDEGEGIGETPEDAGEEAQNAAETTGDKIKDAAGNVKDKVKDVVDDLNPDGPVPPGGLRAKKKYGVAFAIRPLMADLGLEDYTGLMINIAAWTEFVGGLLILVGLFTRLWGLALAGVMVVAFYTTSFNPLVESPLGHLATMGGYKSVFIQLSFFVLAFGLFLTGGGALSLDRFLFKPADDKINDDF